MLYNWQQDDWLEFKYNLAEVEDLLFQFSERLGYVYGMLKSVPKDVQVKTMIDMMVYEAMKTSEIEGEFLSRQDVLSSIRNNLGFNQPTLPVKDKRAIGMAHMMIHLQETFRSKLTKKDLFAWHTMIMSGANRIRKGQWRIEKEPMQVISGSIGKQIVHFEAPPSERVPSEMKQFIAWFNQTGPGGSQMIKYAPIRSAVAHVYFETIHPFEDGNGRIGRAISEKALYQGVGRPLLLSLSKAIERKRSRYYEELKRAQRSNEITEWIYYFMETVLEAQTYTEKQIEFSIEKTKLFDRIGSSINTRQQKVLLKMLANGPDGFEGGMSAKKYVSITRTSRATATRDLQNLVDQGVFVFYWRRKKYPL